jgi:hypothetical protein
MLRTALEGQQPLLIADITPPAYCVFCGKPRPLEMCETFVCHKCKGRGLLQLFWGAEPLPQGVDVKNQ